MLATFDDFQDRYGVDDAEQADVERLLAGVSERIAQEAGRVWAEAAVLEKRRVAFTPRRVRTRTGELELPTWPVIEVHSVIEGVYGDWDSGDTLTEGTDFDLYRRGVLYRIASWWLAGERTVRAIFTGGYTGRDTSEAAGWRPDAWASGSAYTADDRVLYQERVYAAAADIASSTTPPPEDADNWTLTDVLVPAWVRDACLMQAKFWWDRRARIGLVSDGVQGASVSAYARDELLPEVKHVCRRLRR